MGWSTAILEGWLDEIEALSIEMALFSSDPSGLSSPASVEVAGELYMRQDSLWTRTGPTSLTLSDAVIWRGLPPGAAVTAVGGFDDPFAGRFLFSDLLSTPATFSSGGTYVLPAGEYVLGLQ